MTPISANIPLILGITAGILFILIFIVSAVVVWNNRKAISKTKD